MELVGNNACISLDSPQALGWSSKAGAGLRLGLREHGDGENSDFLTNLVSFWKIMIQAFYQKWKMRSLKS